MRFVHSGCNFTLFIVFIAYFSSNGDNNIIRLKKYKMFNLYQAFINLHNNCAEVMKYTAMTFKRRMALYRMLEKMTGEPATLQINDAIIELQTLEIEKDLKTCMWYVYSDIIEQMRNTDADFAKALSKYVPQQDTMIIAASEQDDITLGFTTVIETNQKTNQMKKAFTEALGYPLLMTVVLLAVLYYFSIKIIPAFTESIPEGTVLSSSSQFLVKMANTFNIWFSCVVIVLIAVLAFIMWALPNFTNKYRKYLENVAPFNMYRIMIGCGFLFALNSLSKAGFMQIDALEQMLKLARPYLKYRIRTVMELMADGMDIGQALIYSKLDFPDKQMVRELAIQTKYSEDDSLGVLVHTLAEDGLQVIKQQAQFLKFVITLIVFGTIGFLYFAVYQFGLDLGNLKI
jgi:type II secretory pathway component PulF